MSTEVRVVRAIVAFEVTLYSTGDYQEALLIAPGTDDDSLPDPTTPRELNDLAVELLKDEARQSFCPVGRRGQIILRDVLSIERVEQ